MKYDVIVIGADASGGNPGRPSIGRQKLLSTAARCLAGARQHGTVSRRLHEGNSKCVRLPQPGL